MVFHGGLDWGGASHALCIIDGTGHVVVRLEVRHDAAGLADMVARLKRVAAPADVPIAIERPSGLIVDTLVEAGYPVVPIHPNVVKACRPRYCATGGKSDPGDAFMLADILRTDGHRFRPLLPASDDIRALRALVRGRDDLVAQRTALAKLSSRIEHAVASLPDGRIVMSFPRAGRLCAAVILAELGDVRERFPTEDQLATEAGVCPVIHASGKSRGVVFRWACNKNLRRAVTCFADNSRHASTWAAAIYHKARQRGCKHPHAIRILARAWLRVLWKASQTHAPYDPAQHRAAAKIAA